MADVQQLRSDLLPAPVSPPGHLFGRVHSYGVALDLERMGQGFVPPPRAPRIRTRSRRRRGGPIGSVRRWWATTENGPADVWHRIRCRLGHHEIRGCHQMQLGDRFVYVERRCRWCDAPEPAQVFP